MNNIILCGFMGCGKTTIGKLVAARLSMKYLDLDQKIAQDANLDIPLIFEQYGEAGFRDREHTAICSLATHTDYVVSTGGGAMTFPRNVQALDASDVCVFLDVPFDICYARIKDSDRPLVRSHTPYELRTLFALRQTAYNTAAALTVDASDTPAQAVHTLEALLAQHASHIVRKD